jgi:aspartyl aminopeptidase
LDRTVNDGFTFNKETHLTPVLAQAVKALNTQSTTNGCDAQRHSSVLLDLIATELGVSVDAIGEFELCLYDCNDARTGGANNEFVLSSRLDNLCMSFCSLTVKNDLLIDNIARR